MKQRKKRIIVISIFSWGLPCQCPCSLNEPEPIPTSPGGPPIPLDWSLDLLWALWGQLRLWPGPLPVCTCPESPLLLRLDPSQLWEHSLSIQIFHRHRIYQASHGDLICSLCRCTKDFLFLSHTAPGTQFWFWPHLCMCATLRHLFPAQVRGSESSSWLGHTYSLRPGRGTAATIGMCTNCHGDRDRQAIATDWGALALVEVPPSVRRGRGWHVGVVAAPPLAHHSTMVPHFLGRPHFL